MKEALVKGLFGDGGLLRVRGLIALAFVITGGVGLLTSQIDPELAVIIMFSGAMPYGIQRASKK